MVGKEYAGKILVYSVDPVHPQPEITHTKKKKIQQSEQYKVRLKIFQSRTFSSLPR